MKRIRNSLAWFAASVVMAGAASAQDAFTWFNQGSQANSTAGIIWKRQTEPKVELGSNLRLTGLVVDCLAPQQTWAMLASSAPAPVSQSSLPISQLRVRIPGPINDPAVVHKSHFVLLRLSFP